MIYRSQELPLAVVVLEDTPLMADHLLAVLREWDRPTQVRLCTTMAEGLDAVRSSDIDLLIADLHLPDGLGTEVISLLRQTQPEAQSIVLSALNQKTLVLEAIKLGASGYIHKEDDAIDIIQGCEEILAGGSPMSVSIARLVIESLQAPASGTNAYEPSEAEESIHLTARESEVLNAISRGYKNSEIAKLLGISPQTIPVHVRNIYTKLEVRSRTEAVFEARRLGLLDE